MEFLTGDVLLYVVLTVICATLVTAAAAVYVNNSFRQSSHTATRESADSGAVGRDFESKSDEGKKKKKGKLTRKKLNGGSQKESEESEHRDVADDTESSSISEEDSDPEGFCRGQVVVGSQKI